MVILSFGSFFKSSSIASRQSKLTLGTLITSEEFFIFLESSSAALLLIYVSLFLINLLTTLRGTFNAGVRGSLLSYIISITFSCYCFFSSYSVFTIDSLFKFFIVPDFAVSSNLFYLVKLTSLLITISLICSRVSPSKGHFPIIIAYIRMPRAQISILGSLALSPYYYSGDIYFILPALCLSAIVPLLEPKIPKSAILTCTLEGAVFIVGNSSICSSRITF